MAMQSGKATILDLQRQLAERDDEVEKLNKQVVHLLTALQHYANEGDWEQFDYQAKRARYELRGDDAPWLVADKALRGEGA
jgi:cell division protein FtsB